MTDASKIEAAAKAAYPELWPDGFDDLKPQYKAAIAFNRTEAVTRLAKAIEAYQAAPGEMGDAPPVLGDFAVALPGDAAMVQQVLTAITYIDNEGRSAYTVHTEGEGLLTSWLGMCILTQNYLLEQYGFGSERPQDQ